MYIEDHLKLMNKNLSRIIELMENKPDAQLDLGLEAKGSTEWEEAASKLKLTPEIKATVLNTTVSEDRIATEQVIKDRIATEQEIKDQEARDEAWTNFKKAVGSEDTPKDDTPKDDTPSEQDLKDACLKASRDADGNKVKIKVLLAEYGGKVVREIAEDKRAEIIQKLEKGEF